MIIERRLKIILEVKMHGGEGKSHRRGARIGTGTRYGGIRLGYKPNGKLMTKAESIAHLRKQQKKERGKT